MTSQEVSDKGFGAPKPASVLKGAAVDIDTVIKLRTNGLLLDVTLVRFCFGTRGRAIASGPPKVHLLRLCGDTGLHLSDEARGHVCAMALEGEDDHFLKWLSFILCSQNSRQFARVGVMVQSQPLAFSTASFLVFILFARLRQRPARLPGCCPHPESSCVWVRMQSYQSLTSPWYASLSCRTSFRYS